MKLHYIYHFGITALSFVHYDKMQMHRYHNGYYTTSQTVSLVAKEKMRLTLLRRMDVIDVHKKMSLV